MISRTMLRAAMLGAMLGVVGTLSVIYLIFGDDPEGLDYNGDGQPDEVYEFDGSELSVARVDRNFDGSSDLTIEYTDFLVTGMLHDDNFDGVFEAKGRYLQGQLEARFIDSTGDGVVDVVESYSSGVLYSLVTTTKESDELSVLFLNGRPETYVLVYGPQRQKFTLNISDLISLMKKKSAARGEKVPE